VSRLGEAGAPLHPRIESEIANHLGFVDRSLDGRDVPRGRHLTGADVQMSFVGEVAGAYGKRAPTPSSTAGPARCRPGPPTARRSRAAARTGSPAPGDRVADPRGAQAAPDRCRGRRRHAVFFGLDAARKLSVDAFPDVTNVQVQIATEAPGRSPEEVERFVTVPLEIGDDRPARSHRDALAEPQPGLSLVTLVFTDDRSLLRAAAGAGAPARGRPRMPTGIVAGARTGVDRPGRGLPVHARATRRRRRRRSPKRN
jgi:hypothetical protein